MQNDQPHTLSRKGWLVALLGSLVVIFAAWNVAPMLAPSQTKGAAEVYASGNATWVGRVLENDENVDTYELLRVDGRGDMTTVYQGQISPCDGVGWDFIQNAFTFEHTSSPCVDFAEVTQIAFDQDGDETIRSYHRSDRGEMTFEIPGAPTYTLSPIITEACTGEIGDDTDGKQTTLTGVKITSENGEETFSMSKPHTISCGEYDGTFVGPLLTDVTTYQTGIALHLSTGDAVRVVVGNDREITVTFD